MSTNSSADLSHLHPSARAKALLPAEERLQQVRADRWIGYPRATDALRRLELLLDWPATQRMPNLLIAGPTNNGKSMIIEKFRRDHPAYQPTHEAAMRGEPVIPVVVMGDARRAVGDPVLRHPARGRRSTGPSPMALR